VYFLGCIFAQDKCESGFTDKCMNRQEIKSCCHYNSEKCNNGYYLDNDDDYRGCILDDGRCRTFECSDYKEKGRCIAVEDEKNVKEKCEWVKVNCENGEATEDNGRCVNEQSLDKCCYYDESYCNNGIIKVGNVLKRCYWEKSDSEEGKCLDFMCNKYEDELCNENNEYNVNGGCFMNGEGLNKNCDSIDEVEDCGDIKDRTNCRATKDEEGHIFIKLDVKKNCEWVKQGGLEMCVDSEDVTNCGDYSISDDCNNGWIFDSSSYRGCFYDETEKCVEKETSCSDFNERETGCNNNNNGAGGMIFTK
jgi:hypothetical protein